MKISILCSDENHPVNNYIAKWITENRPHHQIKLCRSRKDLLGGDILFLISCNEIIPKKERDSYSASLVLHASDLPKGRGWSPHIWELSRGASFITLSLIEAEDEVDTGSIWKKTRIQIPDTALWDDINNLLFKAECDLMSYAVTFFNRVTPKPQDVEVTPTYYPLRTPEHSLLDANKTIAEQFDLIRVCDPNRFPAYFSLRGKTFSLKIERVCS